MVIERLISLVEDDFAAVNAIVTIKNKSQIDLIEKLSHHIVQSGGKRLRPLLVLLSSHVFNYQGKEHIQLAAMIEFFHTATLLHDDVIDDSTLRRGQETANEIWGNKASILVGDYLFTQSVQLTVGIQNWKIMNLLADMAHRISCAEITQLSNRNNPSLSISEYLAVIQSKTALLFASAVSIGAILSETTDNMQNSIYNYGLHLGNAFQLIDDLLDYCPNDCNIGKNIGDDLADGKSTMPLLYAFEHGTPKQQEIIRFSLQQGGLQYLDDILNAINTTNAIQYTRDFAAQEIDKSINALQILPDSIYKTALHDLANFVLERSY